ncbi:hypothetical protein HRQ91_02875 [Treponema parvum]|uniref:PorV/PorQ family protein n=1 Tax=Treponema parvum TaxID=138851 RepID=A0A975IE41_9SPIR|nr:hypothetical protein [Treponema parvum]QTQ13483.1 hypothetical protein HRQ91_02875 [Treponema parvum]
MIKRIKSKFIIFAFFLCVLNLYAYNPPAGGENLFGISSPTQLTSASSAAGGAFFDVTPASIAFNPALPAFEQRIMLDAGYTALFASKDPDDEKFASAFQGGLLVPTKWGVGAAEMYGAVIPFYEMQVGKSFNLKMSASRDVTEKLAVGIGLTNGYFYGYNTDFMVAADLGFVYNAGDFMGLKNLRYGISLQNLGKTYTNTTVWGIKGKEADFFPGIAALRIGAAATVFESELFSGAFSLDMTIPSAQNFILDAGLQFMYRNFLKLSGAWQYNAREVIEGSESWLPSLGITFKFMLNSKDSAFMKEKGWQESEAAITGAWKKMYENINALSGGVTLKLGMKDTEAPEIKLFDE